jgi:hypothetical protein
MIELIGQPQLTVLASNLEMLSDQNSLPSNNSRIETEQTAIKDNVPDIIPFEKDEDLLGVIKENNTIFFFLGAGFSKQVGFKLWEELVTATVQKFWEQKESTPKAREITWSIKEKLLNHESKLYVLDYLKQIDKDKFVEIVSEIFKEDQDNIENLAKKNSAATDDIITIIRPLVKLEWYKFVQTNIDMSFEENCEIDHQNVRINANLDDSVKLNYLHGKLDEPDSWILTQGDYLSTYLNSKSGPKAFLVQLFKKYTVIFIGYGFSDYEILQCLAQSQQNDNSSEEHRSKRRQHFAIIPYSTSKKAEISVNEAVLKNNFGVRLLKYNIEQHGYELLKDNLSALVNLIKKVRTEKEETDTSSSDPTQVCQS